MKTILSAIVFFSSLFSSFGTFAATGIYTCKIHRVAPDTLKIDQFTLNLAIEDRSGDKDYRAEDITVNCGHDVSLGEFACSMRAIGSNVQAFSRRSLPDADWISTGMIFADRGRAYQVACTRQ